MGKEKNLASEEEIPWTQCMELGPWTFFVSDFSKIYI